MNVALTRYFEDLIKRLIASGRYNNASDVVRAGLRQLQEIDGEHFPPGSLKHLYTKGENTRESKLARHLKVPMPDRV